MEPLGRAFRENGVIGGPKKLPEAAWAPHDWPKEMSFVATGEMSSVATEEMSSVATEEMSSVATPQKNGVTFLTQI